MSRKSILGLSKNRQTYFKRKYKIKTLIKNIYIYTIHYILIIKI